MTVADQSAERHRTKIGLFLENLGKLLVPPTIIAIICPLLLLGGLETAVASFVTLLLTAIIFFYHPLVKKVPSPIVLMVLVILLTAFFFSYKNIIAKDTGLVAFYKTSTEIIGFIPKKIRSTKREIFFSGTNFHITTVDNRTALLERLSQGVNVKYLVFNPYSPILETVARDFDQTPVELRSECMLGLTYLLELKNRWDKIKHLSKAGDLQIRMYNEFPRVRAYVFDPDNEHSECFLIPYLHHINSTDLPAFQFKNSDDGVFNEYYNSMKELWKRSVDMDVIMAEQAIKDSVQNANGQ